MLTFFFFFGGHHVKILLADMVVSKKKKGHHPVLHATQPHLDCTFANYFRSCSKFFSALEIKDNSNFNKGQGRGVQIKDGWQP